MYQLQTRLLDILNLPLSERIHQLKFFIETGPIKDLQVIFLKRNYEISKLTKFSTHFTGIFPSINTEYIWNQSI